MKARMLLISIALFMILIAVNIGVSANMGGPPSGDTTGPGSEGMNGNPPQGPRWEQQTENKQVEKGLMFRYGKDTPETSIEGEESGSDIGLKVTEVRFRNQTDDLSITIEEEEWEVLEEEVDGGIKVSYNACSLWKNELDEGELSSDIQIDYHYAEDAENRTIEYNVSVDSPPGEGDLTFSFTLDTVSMGEGCCWKVATHQMEKKVLTLRNSDGEDLSQFKVCDNGYLNTDENEMEVETQLEQELVNSTASLDVNMELPTNTRSASISGSLNILEGLVEVFTEGAEEVKDFVIEHIYWFVGGAAIMAVIIISSSMILSKKSVETQGKELDLGKNRYYKGPQ